MTDRETIFLETIECNAHSCESRQTYSSADGPRDGSKHVGFPDDLSLPSNFLMYIIDSLRNILTYIHRLPLMTFQATSTSAAVAKQNQQNVDASSEQSYILAGRTSGRPSPEDCVVSFVYFSLLIPASHIFFEKEELVEECR